MTAIHQHGLNRSIILHLQEKFPDMKIISHFDGMNIPDDRPLIIVEQMPSTNEIISKQREGVSSIYRYQVGLFDRNSVDLSINQEQLTDTFIFDKFTFYDTLKDSEPSGTFLCDLTGVVPIHPDDRSEKSSYHRVYFDIEIETLKRRKR